MGWFPPTEKIVSNYEVSQIRESKFTTKMNYRIGFLCQIIRFSLSPAMRHNRQEVFVLVILFSSFQVLHQCNEGNVRLGQIYQI
jgi:hypothetical protein